MNDKWQDAIGFNLIILFIAGLIVGVVGLLRKIRGKRD